MNTLTLFLVCLKYTDGEQFYATERLVVTRGDAVEACEAARKDVTGQEFPAGNDKDGKPRKVTPKAFRAEWCQAVYQTQAAVVINL